MNKQILSFIALFALAASAIFGTTYVLTSSTTGFGSGTVSATDAGSLGGGVPYKAYAAHVFQTGTSTPDVTVLENTLGLTITWTHGDVGEIWGNITPTNIIDMTKVVLAVDPPYVVNAGAGAIVTFIHAGKDVDKVELLREAAADGPTDDYDLDCTITVHLYP